MGLSTLLAMILQNARTAALTGGLISICRMHLRVGDRSGVRPEDIDVELLGHFQGPLFHGCEVTWESVPGDGVTLVSIEGIPSPGLS